MAKRKQAATTDLGTLDMSPNLYIPPNELTMPTEGHGVADSIGGPVFGFYHSAGRPVPTYATEWSAGVDITANLPVGDRVTFYDHKNTKGDKSVRGIDGLPGRLYIEAGERVLVPTGLYADIPYGWYLAIHSRSGMSWKQGLILTNGVGVVDADYVEEIKVSLTNVSGSRVYIEDGDRIAQILVAPVAAPYGGFATLNKKPNQKTSRAGGFGSTGAK